jgi:hypothetical protein
MKKSIVFTLALLASSTFTFCHAQPMAAPHFHLLNFHKKVTLPAGTVVFLETTEQLDAASLTVGQLLQYNVKTDVIADGKTLIRKGAVATGNIKTIGQPTYNNAGTITIDVLFVQAVDGQQISTKGLEQTFAGKYPGSQATIESGASLAAFLKNETTIKAE